MLGAAGAGLGKIVSISENGGYVSPMPMMKAAMEDSGVPVAGGEIGMSVQVTITFEIAQ
ncbi:MAG: SIMPL domain-containing protein [Cypionkella sp.]|nr:SIMPL domain-containing protein [Cypionkella sp.]